MLLPHPGCCSLLPTAPVASTLDSSTAADPAIGVYVHMHACCHSPAREPRHHSKEWMTSPDDVSSPSGANKLACACCQASPAALVASPSSGVPLSSLDHPI